jgi:erythromycin esterase
MEIKAVGSLLQPWNLDLSEFESLAGIGQCSRIIGIGEGAHFVTEFSLARASLIRYFVEEHGFNTIGLECGAVQGDRVSEWLNPATDDDLKSVVNPLTFALYGSVLIWLKAYLLGTGRNLTVIGIDLPNTLNPREDLEKLFSDYEILDPSAKPEVGELWRSLATISGESAMASSTQWGELYPALRDGVLSGVMRLRLRLMGLAPHLIMLRGNELFQSVSDRVLSVENTLETLRIMNTLFNGTSLQGDSSVRESFMAGVVKKRLQRDPNMKILLLAHNNHIQKTMLSFSGELTAVPMGQHLAHLKDYRAIGATHLGTTVPEMQYPSPGSLLGFSVEPAPADDIQKDSVEQRILDAGGMTASCVVLADDVRGAKRIRSQSASVETNVNEAFDAVLCISGAGKDKLVDL